MPSSRRIVPWAKPRTKKPMKYRTIRRSTVLIAFQECSDIHAVRLRQQCTRRRRERRKGSSGHLRAARHRRPALGPVRGGPVRSGAAPSSSLRPATTPATAARARPR